MIKRCCEVCGKEFKTYPSKLRTGRGKYCSKNCCDDITLFKVGGVHYGMPKGYKLTEEQKEHYKGRIPWNKGTRGVIKANKGSFKEGIRVSPSTEFKMGDLPPWTGLKRFNITGDKHPNWKGGTSFEPYPSDWTKALRERIRGRDNHKCQMCGKLEIENKRKLSIHHIDYDKSNLNFDNLLSLCISCHAQTEFNRGYWQEIFEEVMPSAA